MRAAKIFYARGLPALLALLLAACGGDRPGGGGTTQDGTGTEDATALGKRLHGQIWAAITARDAEALFAMASESLREQGRKRVRKMQAELAKNPEHAAEIQRALKLPKSPLEMSVDELAIEELRARLHEGGAEDAVGELGTDFVDARLSNGRLVVRGRVPAERAHEAPGGLGLLVWMKEQGEWRMDPDASEEVASRWVRAIEQPAGWYELLAVTPDGKTLVIGGGHGVHLLPFEGKGAGTHLAVPNVRNLAVDPRGTWLATSTEGGNMPALPGAESEDTPSGTTLPPPEEAAHEALVGEQPGLVLWRLPSGERWKLLTDRQAYALAASPDGRRLAALLSTDGGAEVVVFDVETGAGTPRPELTEVRQLAYGGPEALVVLRHDGDVRVHALDGRRLLTIPRGTKDAHGPWAVNALGTRAAVPVPTERGPPHVAVLDLATGEELARTKSGLWTRALAFSPDGTEVACGGHSVRRYASATMALLAAHRARRATEDGAIAYHPSGRFLLALGGPDRSDVAVGGPAGTPGRGQIHVFACD